MLIEIHNQDGTPILVHTDKVVTIEPSPIGCNLMFDGHMICSKESYEDVKKIIFGAPWTDEPAELTEMKRLIDRLNSQPLCPKRLAELNALLDEPVEVEGKLTVDDDFLKCRCDGSGYIKFAVGRSEGQISCICGKAAEVEGKEAEEWLYVYHHCGSAFLVSQPTYVIKNKHVKATHRIKAERVK